MRYLKVWCLRNRFEGIPLGAPQVQIDVGDVNHVTREGTATQFSPDWGRKVVNSFPFPGIGVRAVCDRRDVLALMEDAPELARKRPIASRNRLSINKAATYTRGAHQRQAQGQEKTDGQTVYGLL